ncbi:MAG: EFR1 family ferrodoxin [Deltaproteobacteria bacterium]|nr:EFR1 family ferrodoxin [Deltaproteobacteria bacterium]
MPNQLYVYTGTGNSLWIARTLAEELGNSDVIPMSCNHRESIVIPSEALGIIFPVHIWGLPHRVIDFVDTLAKDTPKYYFAIAVNAGQVAATLLQLKKLMSSRGLSLSSGFEIVMPSNYIPWGGPGPEEKRMRKINDARKKIKNISPVIAKGEKRPVEKGPLWQNILFSLFYKLSFRYVHSMDRSFWTDEKCNSCGICKTICPCDNIELKDAKPLWLHHCEQCLACIQWCPQEAIQFGKKTARYERYHHPEVKLQDMMDVARLHKKIISSKCP